MYEVAIGTGNNRRVVYSGDDQVEAIQIGRRQAQIITNMDVTVTHFRPIGTSGRAVPQVIWERSPASLLAKEAQAREQAILDARKRRKIF